MREINSISLRNIGPIKEADVEFGDFTVLVGKQASGKSILSQLSMLMVDPGEIKAHLREQGKEWNNDWKAFLDLYLGHGMGNVWSEDSSLKFVSERYKKQSFNEEWFNRTRAGNRLSYYIPAQRTITIQKGWFETFNFFDTSFPYPVRFFSDDIRIYLDNYFQKNKTLFPQNNRLRAEFRESINEHIYQGAKLKSEIINSQKKLVLSLDESDKNQISVGSWSAGQREFTPLLMGLYHLLPPGRITTSDEYKMVVIEELEMGLHPKAIVGIMLLLMEVLRRPYQIILTTHSPTVLETIWAVNQIIKNGASVSLFLDLFEIHSKKQANKDFAKLCLSKQFKVYYLQSSKNEKIGTTAVDISNLNPSSHNNEESNWGGITGFSSHVNNIVSRIYSEKENW